MRRGATDMSGIQQRMIYAKGTMSNDEDKIEEDGHDDCAKIWNCVW